MKQLQMLYFTGYLTILVSGKMPERFFQKCTMQGIPIWNVVKKGEETCLGTIKKQHLSYIKELQAQTNYTIEIVQQRGLPFLWKRLLQRKPLFIAMIITVMFIFILSNIVWKVEMNGFPKDLEEKITKALKNQGVHPGAWMFRIDTPSSIQQKLLNDVPELLWVGVERKGTSFHLEGVEKLIVKEEDSLEPQDLIAEKPGVIEKMFISKGVPKVAIHDYVTKGKLLVSGNLSDSNENENEKDDKDKKDILVPAQGEIIAKTWYKVNVTIPLKGNYEQLTGKQKQKYYLEWSKLNLPIWNLKSPKYEEMDVEKVEHPVYFLKWKLPFSITEHIYSEKKKHTLNRNKEEAIQIGKEQAEKELQIQLGPKAKILSEKILHEIMEHDKVILTLYISVEEDIAQARSITQKSKEKE